MKKALSLLLVLVMCLSLCACGTEKKSNEIELTPENFNKYVKVERHRVITDITSRGTVLKAYWVLDLNGASVNYDYNDVSVTYKVSTTWYCKGHTRTCEFNATASTDISGHCYAGEDLSHDFFRCSEHKDQYAPGDRLTWNWEVISVTGTLTPVG